MKNLKFMVAGFIFAFMLGCASAWAKADVAELYVDAVVTANVPELEKILAPNFWYIGANGHIRDKENFIREIRDKVLVVDHMTFMNLRETKVGDTRMITANGTFKGKSAAPRPQGLMRYTMVVANNDGQEQIALFQATPVVATDDCQDGNCKIK